MGFFALRKADQSSLYVNQDQAPASGLPGKSVTQLIRARFNGRKGRQVKLGYSSPSPILSAKSSSADPVDIQEQERFIHRGDGSNCPSRQSHQLDRHRTSSDVITMTLAQRLNELATSHADGLLSDDDYRVLRQNLFSTFAPHSAPPVETPVVKSVEPVSLRLSSTSRSDCSTVNSARAPSLLTHTTSRSSVSTLFHRLRKRTSEDHGSEYEQDRASVLSSSSRIPLPPVVSSTARELGRQASDSSLKTARSRHMAPDLRSVSSRRSMRSVATASDVGGMSRGSTKSLRGNEPPPSSFNTKYLSSRLLSLDRTGDRSAADIRAEIRATEAEQQSVLAAFSLLARPQFDSRAGHTQVSNPTTVVPGRFPSALGMYRHDKRSTSEPCPADTCAVHNETELTDQCVSFLNSQQDHLGFTIGMRADEIERRRAEINIRYQQRLDYLKARLKGAEIHERLLRK